MFFRKIAINHISKALLFSLVGLASVFLGVGCSSSTSSTPSSQTTPPVQTATQAPATTTETAPASAAKVALKMTGDVNKSGTFEARCAAYFPADNKGVVFETHADGWWLQVGDSDNRREGPQNPVAIGVLNGPTASYAIEPGAEVVFGPGFKSATVKAKFKQLYKENFIDVDATFSCG